jgi:phenylacetate-coenzyme A ligase PaaK-like adenylate-forming protein
MNSRRKLFFQRDPYDLDRSRACFLDAVRENVELHRTNCAEYAAILRERGFDVDCLKTEDDLYKIPVIPTLYLKRNRLFSVPEDKLVVKATSSGTRGQQSIVGFDRSSLFYGIGMMVRFFAYHRVISPMPTNYIVLGYQPSKHAQMGAIKTAHGTTRFAPALHREYALKDTGTGYVLNLDGIRDALFRYARQGLPVRFVGFPSYMYFLVKMLQEHGISLKLNRNSRVLLGGGWKQFSAEEIDRPSFYQLIEETLGIEKRNCLEFFSAVEHPLAYCKCENGHFHVPAYSRVIIRDVRNLEPVPNGQTGLLSLISPLVSSMPLTSIVTDDLAIQHDGALCGCGIKTPYFELQGRAGVRQIKTCTMDAAALLGSVEG